MWVTEEPLVGTAIGRESITATHVVIERYLRVTPDRRDDRVRLRAVFLPARAEQAYVDRVVLVSDAAIRHAQEALWALARIVAEPSGTAPLATLLGGGYTPAAGERVAVIISGGNTTAVDFDGPGWEA
jgi:hypothetical protein